MHEVTWEDFCEEVAERLRQVSRDRTVINYGDIVAMLEIDVNNPRDRNDVNMLLYDINRQEMKEGRPLLTAVVVRKDTLKPGRGFFRFAREEGLLLFGDKNTFYLRERGRVHDYWASRSELN